MDDDAQVDKSAVSKNAALLLKRRGQEARRKAQILAGGARIPSAAWYPSLVWLADLGYKRYEIAEAVQLDPSSIRKIFREGKLDPRQGLIRQEHLPVAPEALDKKYQAMLEFTPQAFKEFYEEFSGYSLPEHCYQWVQEFIDHRNLMLNVPPRHMKSTIFSQWIPVWLLTRNRDEQIILVSKTKDFAVQWASDIANTLEFNEELVNTFGRFAPERKGDSPWKPGAGQLLVLGRQRKVRGIKFSVLSVGSKGQVFGREATVVIVDDPTDASVASSEVENVRQMEWLREQVLSRIETPKRGGASGRAVIVGQRVHFQDLYGQIAAQVYEREPNPGRVEGPHLGDQLWTVITHKAVERWPEEDPAHPEPKVLWPEFWPFEELMVQYERIGGHKAFSTLFQQEPLPDDAKLVRPEWWERCRDYDRPLGRGARQESGDAFFPISRVLSLDPSPRNLNGLVVADVMFNREQFVCSILEVSSFVGNLRDVMEVIGDKMTSYRPDYFVMESSAVTGWAEGDPAFVDIKRRTKFLPHATYKNKADPELGVESLAGDVEGGRIRLPYGDEAGRKQSTDLESEFNVWPFGEHDDMMMAVWFIKYNYRKFVPPGAYAGHFQGRAGGSWSFLRKDAQLQTADVVRRFRAERDKSAV